MAHTKTTPKKPTTKKAAPAERKPRKQRSNSYYRSPEEFATACDAYFDDPDCDFTITGLTLALGFSHKKSFYEYRDRDGYRDVACRAQLRVENAYERKLADPRCTGAIFALKNMGWTDKVEHTGAEGKPMEITIRYV